MTILCVGRPRSGKSRYLKRLVAHVHARDRDRRVLVYCPHRVDREAPPDDLYRREGAWYHSARRLERDVAEHREPWLCKIYRADDVDALARIARGMQRARPILILDETVSLCDAGGWKAKRFPALEDVWARGRHEGLSILIATQRLAMVPTAVREFVDVTLLFRMRASARNVRILEDEYGPGYAAATELDEPTWEPLVYPEKGLDTLAQAWDGGC